MATKASPSQTITAVDVERTSNFTALMVMVQELGIDVPLEKQTITGFKTLLLDHITRRGGSKIVKGPKDWDTTSAASIEDLTHRMRLREFYKQTSKYISTLPGPFQADLREFFPGYEQQLITYTEELNTSKCVLLIAGDKAAGKSSLVNLLLGQPVMPTSDLQCTATIVEIQYGTDLRADIFYRDDSSGKSRHPIVEKGDNNNRYEFIKRLEEYIRKRDPETEESPYDKIQLYLPLEMLKGGVTIVDSPGVGDSKALPQQLADYMERAFGFIYVIDSGAAIHKHRLGQLLLKATERTNDMFDQDTALFVCNRWDLVTPGDSQRVLDSMADRLSMIIPGIKKSQLFPISIKDSTAFLEYGKVTDEHKNLIEGIRTFLPLTMRAKLRIYYRYLSQILKRSLYSLRLSYLSTKNTMTKMQDEAVKRDKRRNMLDRNSQEKLDNMRHEVGATTIKATDSLLQHLNSMHARSRVCTWRDDRLPKREKWQNMVKNANAMISERLAVEINEWEHESKIIESVAKRIVDKFQKQFQLFTNEVAQVEGVFLNSDEIKFMRDVNQALNKNQKKVAQKGKDESYMSLGASIVSSLALDPKDSEVRRLFRDTFEKDPEGAMRVASELYLGLLNEGTAISCIRKFFDRFVKGIDRVGKFVPQLMKADNNLLQDINRQLTDKEAKLQIFPKLSRECSSLQGDLDMMYLQRLMPMDYTADKFKYDSSKDMLGKGSFATVYKCTLGDKFVALKEPRERITKNDVTDILLEESMLRFTTHKNIVTYYGAYRKGPSDGMFLNMVMEFCPKTLKDMYVNKHNSPSDYGDNPVKQTQAIGHMTFYLLQICDGMNYLHEKSIVHRDLKPENLLLTESNVVKIADLGLAKSVQQIATVGIGTPVYMAPEILLLFSAYDTKADIYSFAMIIWELWYGQDLARYAAAELQGGLKVNIENGWRPSMTIPAVPTTFWAKLIAKCWDREPSRRPIAKEIGLKLVEVYKQVQEFMKSR